MNDLATRPEPSARRSRKKMVIATVAVIAVVAGVVGLALFQPWKLFTRSTVNEGFPVAATAPAAPPAAGSTAPTVGPTTAPITPPTVDPTAPTVEPTVAQVTVAPQPPATEPVVLASGTFVDGEHTTTGTATIFQLPDGSRVLRLENFSTSDGPDVDVALSDQTAGGDEWGKYDDGRYLGLGDLKGTDGNQNYEIPADADLSGLTSVVIWCDRFNVAFGTAAITG